MFLIESASLMWAVLRQRPLGSLTKQGRKVLQTIKCNSQIRSLNFSSAGDCCKQIAAF